jgi:hypothetical protein
MEKIMSTPMSSVSKPTVPASQGISEQFKSKESTHNGHKISILDVKAWKDHFNDELQVAGRPMENEGKKAKLWQIGCYAAICLGIAALVVGVVLTALALMASWPFGVAIIGLCIAAYVFIKVSNCHRLKEATEREKFLVTEEKIKEKAKIIQEPRFKEFLEMQIGMDKSIPQDKKITSEHMEELMKLYKNAKHKRSASFDETSSKLILDTNPALKRKHSF